MRHLVSFATATAVIALLFAGCNTPPTAAVGKIPEEVRILLDEYEMTDQKIVENADGVQTDCLLPPVSDAEYGVYSVTFIWGRLLAARVGPPETVDWSGSLGVSGAEGVVKAIIPIDFEDGDTLLPAVDPSLVAWASKTTGDFDGLGFLVRVRTASALTDCVPCLSFETDPFSLELPIAKLNCFAAYYPVSDTEGVAVIARRVGEFACPRGFMKGEWVPEADSDDRGSFHGMWYDLFGVPVGSMSGSFGTDNDGTRRFKGCLSGVYLTVVLAELEGAWSHDDPRMCVTCGEGHGRFEGKFRYLNCERTGVMLGEFGDFSSVSETAMGKRALPLRGIWRAHCAKADDTSDANGD